MTFREAKDKKWDIVYFGLADMLLVTNKIPRKSNPIAAGDDVVIYYGRNNKNIVGLLLENVRNNSRLYPINKFISSKKDKRTVYIPFTKRNFDCIRYTVESLERAKGRDKMKVSNSYTSRI